MLPDHFNPESGSRQVLALEGLKMVGKDQDGSCKWTRPGQRDLNRIARQVSLRECRVASVVSDSL